MYLIKAFFVYCRSVYNSSYNFIFLACCGVKGIREDGSYLVAVVLSFLEFLLDIKCGVYMTTSSKSTTLISNVCIIDNYNSLSKTVFTSPTRRGGTLLRNVVSLFDRSALIQLIDN